MQKLLRRSYLFDIVSLIPFAMIFYFGGRAHQFNLDHPSRAAAIVEKWNWMDHHSNEFGLDGKFRLTSSNYTGKTFIK